MKRYIAYIEIDSEIEPLNFETEENPIDFIWGRYGISTYIESVSEVEEEDLEEPKEEIEEAKNFTEGEESTLKGDVNVDNI